MYKICHYLQTLNIQFLIISIYKIFPINRDLIIYIKHDLTEHGIYKQRVTVFPINRNFFITRTTELLWQRGIALSRE